MARRRVKVSHQSLLQQRRLPMPRPTQVTPDPKRRVRGKRPKEVESSEAGTPDDTPRDDDSTCSCGGYGGGGPGY